MHKFICIRQGPNCRPGEWFIGEEVGEPLFKADMLYSRDGAKLTQSGHLAIPFESLAAYIIEPGFTLPRSALDKLDEQKTVQELADFQSEHEDLIEPAMEQKGREANPSIIGKSGVFIDKRKKDDKDS